MPVLNPASPISFAFEKALLVRLGELSPKSLIVSAVDDEDDDEDAEFVKRLISA